MSEKKDRVVPCRSQSLLESSAAANAPERSSRRHCFLASTALDCPPCLPRCAVALADKSPSLARSQSAFRGFLLVSISIFDHHITSHTHTLSLSPTLLCIPSAPSLGTPLVLASTRDCNLLYPNLFTSAMAGDGLDDELLALAGGSDDERPRKSSSSAANHAATKSDSDLDAHADAHAHAHADADLVSASRKRSSAKPTSISKRRRLDLLDESDSSDQDAPGSDHDASDDSATAQSANPNPYPLYGIYKNQNDMDQLLEMNELDREMVLSERRAQLEKRQQRIELASLVRSQKAAAGATKNKAASNKKKSLQRSKPNRRSLSDLDQSSDDDHDQQDHDADADSDQDAEGSDYSANFTSAVSSAAKARKKKAVGSTDTKTAKLSELRKRRKEKASGVRRHQSDDDASSPKKRRGTTYLTSDSESDFSDDYGSEDGYGRTNTSAARSKVGRDRDREDRGTGGKREPPSLSDLNSVRISRDLVEHKLYAPKWKEALTGSFIRFSWGMRDRADGQGKEQVYRIHQVQGEQYRALFI